MHNTMHEACNYWNMGLLFCFWNNTLKSFKDDRKKNEGIFTESKEIIYQEMMVLKSVEKGVCDWTEVCTA